MELALELRDELQAAVVDAAEWPRLLERLADRLGAREATFGGGHCWEQTTFHAPRTDPSYLDVYLDTYHQQNSFMQALLPRSLMRVVAGHELPEFEDLQQTEFYKLWCQTQGFHHLLGFSLESAGGWRGTMAINLDTAAEPDQIVQLTAFMPHVQRVVDRHVLLEELRRSNQSALSAFAVTSSGAMLLDRHGRVLELNTQAEEILSSCRLSLQDGRLQAVAAREGAKLNGLIQQCLTRPDIAGGRVRLTSKDGDLTVRCAPFPGSATFPTAQRPAVIVVISDPLAEMRQRLIDVQRNYGLTHAEAELAMAVLQTGSRKAAAEMRGVSDSTARTQLSSIFDKTGVRRQTELVRLLLDDS